MGPSDKYNVKQYPVARKNVLGAKKWPFKEFITKICTRRMTHPMFPTMTVRKILKINKISITSLKKTLQSGTQNGRLHFGA